MRIDRDATASKEMAPTCENITEVEERLDGIARSYDGRADGWGFLPFLIYGVHD